MVLLVHYLADQGPLLRQTALNFASFKCPIEGRILPFKKAIPPLRGPYKTATIAIQVNPVPTVRNLVIQGEILIKRVNEVFDYRGRRFRGGSEGPEERGHIHYLCINLFCNFAHSVRMSHVTTP